MTAGLCASCGAVTVMRGRSWVLVHEVGCAEAAVQRVADAIRRRRFRYVHEEQLQEAIAAALVEDGLIVRREVRLDHFGRIDLMVGMIGVEVKVDGAAAAVERQVRRYVQSGLLDGIVVVTSRVRHVRLPVEIDGCPVEVVTLVEAGL